MSMPRFRTFTPPTPENRTITPGNRIFVRLTMTTGESMEFYVTDAEGMSGLLGSIRHEARHLRGLGKIWIRNTSCGWATERPLRLYGSKWDNPANQSAYHRPPATTPSIRNLGPWETH